MYKQFSTIKKLVALSVLCFSTGSYAIDPYVGLSYGFWEYKEKGLSDTSLDTVYLRVGASFNKYFSGELRYGDGVKGDSLTSKEGIPFDMDLTEYYGAYVRGGYPLTDSLFPYLIVGYSSTEIKASAMGMDFYASESTRSIGLGLDYAFTKTCKLNIEYTDYVNEWPDGQVIGLSIGISRTF